MVEEVAKSWQRPGMYSERTSSGLGEVALEVGYRRNLAPSDMSSGIGESYAAIRETGFIAAATESLSTFSIDVDTASYANVRRFLRDGRLPPVDAVRIEELINYFPYRYAAPSARSEVPFAANLAVFAAPWAPGNRLVRIGIKGRELATETRPAANLVFLVDVSGSMRGPNRLPLVKDSLRLLVGRLRPDDRVAIVTYAGASGLALPSTPVARSEEILASLDRLEAGGSTNGGMGIHLAYDVAKANFRPNGINRVILCTDGDFNVGVTSRDALLELVQEKARSRVYLTVLGFGMGNFKDGTLELISNKGNGTYGYIDSAREARKVFVEQVEGTLATIAKDVKIQVEFNPARVASYRFVGYENRMLAKEDFNNDAVDAGDVGAGHTVTALYEIVPTGVAGGDGAARPAVDPLRYGPRRKPTAPKAAADDEVANELLTVKIRYKAPDGDVSRVLEFPLVDRGAGFAAADTEFKFAAAVAAWGMLLRESPHAGAATSADVLVWAEAGFGNDPEGHRAEFVELVRKARTLRE
jgi:Ca-activated chloride channel family protein